MQSFLQHIRSTRSSAKHLGRARYLGRLLLLSGVASISSAMLAAMAPDRAWAGDLEFSAGSYPSPPSGPLTTSGSATLLENTAGSTFVPYTPSISMGISFSNLQYTNGLVMGVTGSGTSKALTPASVFSPMNTFGGPTSGLFTSTPNSPVGTGISVTDNYAFLMFASVEPLFNAGLPTNGRYYYGDLTITFSRPVSDPVIQMVGMGGSSSQTVAGVTKVHGHSAEFELQGTGLVASKLSGSTYLDVTNNKITNTAAVITASCTTGAACGSVKITGTNITTLTFKVYVRGDAQPGAWSTATAAVATAGNSGDSFLFGGVSLPKPATVSGTVFDDANGLTNNIIGGTGTNAGGLFANLADSAGQVVASSAVAANGTYSFLGVGAGQYTVSLSTTAGVLNSAPPPPSLPANWINTGEGTTPAGDGTVNGTVPITVTTVDLLGVNFGIDQLPNTTDLNPSSQANPGGTVTVQVPTLAGTDPEDGALGNGKSFKIVTLPTNGTLAYNGSLVTAGQVIANYDPTLLKLDPNDGAITVSFTYAAIDSANQVDASTAIITMPFTVAAVVNGTCQPDGLVWVSGASGQIGYYRVSNQAFTTVSNGTGKVWGDIAWASDNKLYGATFVSSPSLYEIDPTTGASTLIASLSGVLRFPNAISGLPDHSLLIGAASNAKVYRFDLTTPSNPPTIWHDFGAGDPSGDFILFNNKIYVAWRNAGIESLYEVTIDANYNYVSHRDLGALPANAWGLALVYNKLYIASNTTLYRINGIPTNPIASIPVTAVMQNTPYPLYGASGIEEPFGGCTPMVPNLLLVKRITAINNGTNSISGDNLSGYIDSVTDPYDDNVITIPTQSTPADPAKDTTQWPNPSTFLIGGINGGQIKPDDEMEYTIYFLSTGDAAAKNVLFCDRVPANVTFSPTAFNSLTPAAGGLASDRGIALNLGGSTLSLTNVGDGDSGQFFPAGVEPTTVYPQINCGGPNTNGAVVVKLGDLPNATAPGAPIGSFGFVRFKARVK
jgi:uncharacterized repeat protein (TIGR01451 family)